MLGDPCRESSSETGLAVAGQQKSMGVLPNLVCGDSLTGIRETDKPPLCVARQEEPMVRVVSIGIGVAAVVGAVVSMAAGNEGLMLLFIGVALVGFGVGGWFGKDS